MMNSSKTRAPKVALIGADGQLGSDLMKAMKGQDLSPLYYPDFDITKTQDVRKTLAQLGPEIVINTAAYHRVDECEENPHQSFLINAIKIRDLAVVCRELEVVLVHFSTDYVFDGEKRAAYTEEDPPNPLSVYGVSKLAGEYFVRNTLEKHVLVRTCGLYGEAGCWGKGNNFVDTMIALAEKGRPLRVVDDQVVTPTSTAELAARIAELIACREFGLFHLTNEGQCTWYEFAQAIFDILGWKPRLEPVDSRTFGAKAQRPAFSVLENSRAKKIGLTDFSDWRVALRDYLKRKAYLKG